MIVFIKPAIPKDIIKIPNISYGNIKKICRSAIKKATVIMTFFICKIMH